MITEMVNVAVECVQHPKRASVWAPELGRHICSDSEESKTSLAEEQRIAVSHPARKRVQEHSRIDPSVRACACDRCSRHITIHPPLCSTNMVQRGRYAYGSREAGNGLFDIARIGFDAVVGLLGGKVLQGEHTSNWVP